MPESGRDWFISYYSHCIRNIALISINEEVCLLYKRSDSRLEGVFVLKVECSFQHADKDFLNIEENGSKKINCKQRKVISMRSRRLSRKQK